MYYRDMFISLNSRGRISPLWPQSNELTTGQDTHITACTFVFSLILCSLLSLFSFCSFLPSFMNSAFFLLQDIDCMPLNPLENLPASLLRQNAAISKFAENYNELKMNEQSKESKMEENIKFTQRDNLENTFSPSRTSPLTFNVGNLLQPVKVS